MSRASEVLAACIATGARVATAESCTGGMVAARITDLPGSSAALDRGFVTYSNEAKIEMIGVPAETIAAHGAVSRETAQAMALGALAHSHAAVSVAITGIAGPGGGSADKPVGLVWFAAADAAGVFDCHERLWQDRSREAIREAATEEALGMLLAGLVRLQADAGP